MNGSFRVVDCNREIVCSMQRIETTPPKIIGHRSVLYKKLRQGESYKLIIAQSNGLVHAIPIKFIKNGELQKMDLQIWACMDIEFEYDES